MSMRSALAALRSRLIDNWKSAWRLWSVQISFLGAAFSAAWAVLPADTRAHIPGQMWISVALFVLILVSRLFQQGGNSNG